MFSWGRRGWWERPGRTRRARDHSRALSPGFLIPLNEILRKNPPRWKKIPWEADNPNPSTPAKQGKHGQTDGIAFESFEFDKENMRKARSSMTISQRKCTFKTLKGCGRVAAGRPAMVDTILGSQPVSYRYSMAYNHQRIGIGSKEVLSEFARACL